MHKLLSPALVLSVVFAFVISACGRDAYLSGTSSKMTEQEAFSEISNNLKNTRGAFGKTGSADGLQKLLEQMVADGRIKVQGHGRGAVDLSQVDLSGITQILSLISNGKANNVFSLATQLLTLAPSLVATAQSGASKFDIIMSILQQAAPIIMTVAPQFAPIISALLVIVPLVASFVKMFKKPVPQPSPKASLFNLNFARA